MVYNRSCENVEFRVVYSNSEEFATDMRGGRGATESYQLVVKAEGGEWREWMLHQQLQKRERLMRDDMAGSASLSSGVTLWRSARNLLSLASAKDSRLSNVNPLLLSQGEVLSAPIVSLNSPIRSLGGRCEYRGWHLELKSISLRNFMFGLASPYRRHVAQAPWSLLSQRWGRWSITNSPCYWRQVPYTSSHVL